MACDDHRQHEIGAASSRGAAVVFASLSVCFVVQKTPKGRNQIGSEILFDAFDRELKREEEGNVWQA